MKSGTNSTSILLNTQKETRSRWGRHRLLRAMECWLRGKNSTATPQDTKHAQFVQSQDLCTWKQEAHGTHILLVDRGRQLRQ
jgi:hypothetical protein